MKEAREIERDRYFKLPFSLKIPPKLPSTLEIFQFVNFPPKNLVRKPKVGCRQKQILDFSSCFSIFACCAHFSHFLIVSHPTLMIKIQKLALAAARSKFSIFLIGYFSHFFSFFLIGRFFPPFFSFFTHFLIFLIFSHPTPLRKSQKVALAAVRSKFSIFLIGYFSHFFSFFLIGHFFSNFPLFFSCFLFFSFCQALFFSPHLEEKTQSCSGCEFSPVFFSNFSLCHFLQFLFSCFLILASLTHL